MIDKSGYAKLIDFGLARLIDSVAGASGQTTSCVAFSIRWCAPELARTEETKTTKASDVYAFASTALQVNRLCGPVFAFSADAFVRMMSC